MKSYSRSHLSDGTLLSNAHAHLSQDRAANAELLADLAEIEERRVYASAGFCSMRAYCLEELHLSDDEAFNRLPAARTARRFPEIFTALAEGRLHMTAVNLMAPHLTVENAKEFLAAATHKSKSEIQLILAQRFPRRDVPALVQPLGPLQVRSAAQLSPGPVEQPVPERVETPTQRPKLKPLAPQRFALQLTIGQSAHDKLRYVEELLGHQIPSADLSEVFERLLDLAIPQLEKRKFASTSKPRSCQPRATATDSRHVPTAVQRAVWERDGGQCTFVSDTGHRCSTRKRLEFDHIQEVARGGPSTPSNVRLLCRTHNQYAAEQTYGPGFMKARRQDAAEKRAAAAAQKARKAVDEVIVHICESWDAGPMKRAARPRDVKPSPMRRSWSACAWRCVSSARGHAAADEAR